MAIEIKTLKRVFTYNGMNIQDPDPSMSPEEVRVFCANMYPELTNATISSSTHNDTIVYTMKPAVGTKG